MKKTIISWGFAVMLAWVSPVAFAHATLVASWPESEGVIGQEELSVMLQFNKPVRLLKLVLTNDHGDETRLLTALQKTGQKTSNHALPPLSAGHYVISWMAMGKDTHKLKGEWAFTVK